MFVVCADAKNISFFINDNDIVVFVDNAKRSLFFHSIIIDVIKKTRLKNVKKTRYRCKCWKIKAVI